MKTFKFSLQSVHDVREMRSETERLKLADLQSEVADATAKLLEAESLRQKATAEYSRKLRENELDAFEMALTTKFLNVLFHREREARQRLANLTQSCQHQSERVAEAAQSLEVTNKLKAKHRARYDAEVDRHEQNNLDEMVSMSYARKISQTQ